MTDKKECKKEPKKKKARKAKKVDSLLGISELLK